MAPTGARSRARTARPSPRDWRAALAVCIVLVTVLTALLTPASASPQSTRSDIASAGDISQLTWAFPATIRTLDYVHSADVTTASIIALGLECLLRYDKDGALQPSLAQSWTHPNALTYKLQLRPNVKFWDGHALTSADVVFSIVQLQNPKSQWSSFFTSLKSIKASGSRGITIKLKNPDPFFQYSLGFGFIIEKAFALKHRKDIGTPQVLTMGTGPFQIVKYLPDESVTLQRNGNYWGPKPAIKKLVVRFITSEPTRLLALRAGQIDGTFSVPLDQVDQYKSISGVSLQTAPELRTAFFTFDTEAQPWSDVHVRRALGYSLDKAGLVHAVLRGYGQPADSLPPPEQWGALASPAAVRKFYKGLPTYKFNLDKAKAELAKSAYPNGFTATIVYPDSRQPLGKAAQSLSQNLKQIGITLNVKEVTTDEWFNGWYSHKDLGIQILSYGADYPDPSDYASLMLDSKNAVANAFNLANYKKTQVDGLIAKQAAATNPQVRTSIIKQIWTIVARDEPYLPIWYQDIAMAIKSKYTYTSFNPWYFYQTWAQGIRLKK
jgi:peptide/nickel transport system substrate-binding protein